MRSACRALSTLSVGLLAACAGGVMGPVEDPDDAAPSPNRGAGAAGSAGSVGAAGSTGAPGTAGASPGRPATPGSPTGGVSEPPGAPLACAPGARPILRRLNAREWANAVRALLGPVAIDPRALPEDVENSKGFDTDGAALLLRELDANKYYVAAEAALDEAFGAGRLEPCADAACARATVSSFLRKAFRRPVSDDLLRGFQALAATEPDVTGGLKKALHAALLSPRLLYVTFGDAAANGTYTLDPHELAERLALFLWSSLPDEPLMQLADAGRLTQPEVLGAEVTRMLADPRAAELTTGFVRGWLTLDKVSGLARSARTFPESSPALLRAMESETESFIRALLAGRRPIKDVLLASDVFVNDALARLYGVSGIAGAQLQRADAPAGRRRGLLTQASFLAQTGADTAGMDASVPIHRGTFLTRRILCSELPPPPPDVPPAKNTGATLKERLSQHKSSPSCGACHAVLDPLGVAFETYDGLGRYRARYAGGAPIDSSERWNDLPFAGAMDLIPRLASDDAFPRCLTEHLAAYAIGRLTGADDACQVKAVASAATTLPELVDSLTRSDLFRKHRSTP